MVRKLKSVVPSGFGKLRSPGTGSPDPGTTRVVFGFRHIVKGFDLSAGNGKDAGNFIDGLRMRCNMTWAELRSQQRQKLGSEKIAPSMNVGIPASIPTDK